jgi:molecular chaperone HscA
MISTTLDFIRKNKSFLTSEEIEETNVAVNKLRSLVSGTDKDAIHDAIEKLNDISRPYAERLMDTAIGLAMKGKKI